MTSDRPPVDGWWGPQPIELGAALHWRIGPLDLWIQRLRNEWRVAFEEDCDPFDTTLVKAAPADADQLAAHPALERYGLSDSGDRLVLGVAPADRPVISRPERPFAILPAEDATVYVSTPLWLQVRAAQGAVLLREMPFARPSDTWFGANTRDGEIGYTSRTYFVLHDENLPRLPHRAITALRVINRADTPLTLDRLRLPAPQLGVYAASGGALWTQDVTYERTQGDEFAELRVHDRAPRKARDAERIAEPREPVTGNLVVRAFSTLFQRGKERG